MLVGLVGSWFFCKILGSKSPCSPERRCTLGTLGKPGVKTATRRSSLPSVRSWNIGRLQLCLWDAWCHPHHPHFVHCPHVPAPCLDNRNAMGVQKHSCTRGLCTGPRWMCSCKAVAAPTPLVMCTHSSLSPVLTLSPNCAPRPCCLFPVCLPTVGAGAGCCDYSEEEWGQLLAPNLPGKLSNPRQVCARLHPTSELSWLIPRSATGLGFLSFLPDTIQAASPIKCWLPPQSFPKISSTSGCAPSPFPALRWELQAVYSQPNQAERGGDRWKDGTKELFLPW